EGQDYYLDPSRLWFALTRRLGSQEFLAVSYVTVLGDTVGTFPAVEGGTDTLELIVEPRHEPTVPTFFYELRNVYRVGGAEVIRHSIRLSILVNESERPLGGQRSYLELLGLAQIVDPSALDEYNRVFPRVRDPGQGAPIRDLFVVFPHLTPFADMGRLAPAERNDSLYRTPTYLLGSQGPPPRVLMRFTYDASGAGDRANLSLGTIQVREGSEKLFAGDRRLVRGRDYEIDYELGQVRFLKPDSLFFGPTEIRAEFEENQLFDLAPKSIVGLASTLHLDSLNRLHMVAMFQHDRSVFTRPLLGFEPESHFIGGLTSEFELRPQMLTRAVDALPLIDTDVPSRLTINGEVALSRPNPNQAGIAFIEDFQQQAARTIRLDEREFQLGSAPSSGYGLPLTHLGVAAPFDPQDAVVMVRQNVLQTASGTLQFGPQDIDSSIALTGAGFQVEPVLWLSLEPDTVGGAPDPATGQPRWLVPHTPGPRWSSVTRSLGGGSGVGVDLSRVEFLEFWVLEDQARTVRARNGILVFDFGSVFEDAVARAPASFRVVGGDTVFAGTQPVGVGRLDSEKDPFTNVFNAVTSDVGIHGDVVSTILDEGTGRIVRDLPLCDLSGVVGVPAFPRGHLAATCTRRNGRLDTEDLDGDNRLDVDVGAVAEDLLRYVFRVGDSRYYVRDGETVLNDVGQLMTWRLYRIPFRTDSLQIGRPNIRQIEALRLTFVAPPQAGAESELVLALARLRLVAAPWVKRAETPIVGLSGARGEPHGEVTASIVSTDNADLGYTSPPGLGDQADQPTARFQIGQQEINEKSLRLLARDLRAGERAEAFTRFAAEADRNFLNYRRLRVWARGRGAGWEEGDLVFYIKAGRDEFNFYLYRAPASTDSWEPEIVIDLARWLQLRAEIEAAWLRGDPPSGSAECGGDSTAYVRCEGPYMVQVRDPAVAPPNLARVSEVAVGMIRETQTVTIAAAELWVDDIRLSDVVADPGTAAALDARLTAADVMEFTFSTDTRDDRFRQLGQEFSYITDRSTRFGTLLRADKLFPEDWGLSLPVSVQHTRTGSDPFYLEGTDVRASALENLRRPRASATILDLSFRRVKRGDRFFTRNLLDPVTVRARRETAANSGQLSRSATRHRELQVTYDNLPEADGVAAVPSFLRRLIGLLPRAIRESEFGKAARTARLRLNPYRIRVSSGLVDRRTERFTFRVPVKLPGDSAVVPLEGITSLWRNEAALDFRPFSTLSLQVRHASIRDLRDYGDTTTMGRLLGAERNTLLGSDVGFERDRIFTTAVAVSPVVSSWLQPRARFASQFGFTRDPNARAAVRTDAGSTAGFRLPETLRNARIRELGMMVDLARLAGGVAGDAGEAAPVVGAILPVDVSVRRERRSVFDRAPFEPDLEYQLALGGLDEFRWRDGVPATSAAELRELTVTGGTLLPLSGRLTLNYRRSISAVWSRRGDVQSEVLQRTCEWPSVSVSWAHSPAGSLQRVLATVAAQLNYQLGGKVVTQSMPGAGGATGAQPRAVEIESKSRLISPTMTVAWAGGVTTTGGLTISESQAITAGNITETDRLDWGGTVTFVVSPPVTLFAAGNEIRTTGRFNSSKVTVCLLRAGSDECRTVADSRRRQLDLRLDTGLSSVVRGGASFGYVLSDQRHSSSKISQVVFTVFADINLFTGQLR
ncbi:MAG: cell surface protein SprA, partial [Gemmatimonadales bacterium]